MASMKSIKFDKKIETFILHLGVCSNILFKNIMTKVKDKINVLFCLILSTFLIKLIFLKKSWFRGSTFTKWFFVYLIPGWIGIWKCWFLRRGENESTWRKTSWSKGKNQNKLKPHMALTPGFEPGPHWWEVRALTSAPSRVAVTSKTLSYWSFWWPLR